MTTRTAAVVITERFYSKVFIWTVILGEIMLTGSLSIDTTMAVQQTWYRGAVTIRVIKVVPLQHYIAMLLIFYVRKYAE